MYSLANLPRTLYTDAQHAHHSHILEYRSWMQLIKPSFMDKMDSDIKPVELLSRKNFLKQICFLMRPDFTQAQYLVYCQAVGFSTDAKKRSFELKQPVKMTKNINVTWKTICTEFMYTYTFESILFYVSTSVWCVWIKSMTTFSPLLFLSPHISLLTSRLS